MNQWKRYTSQSSIHWMPMLCLLDCQMSNCYRYTRKSKLSSELILLSILLPIAEGLTMQVEQYSRGPVTWHRMVQVPCHLGQHQQTGHSGLVLFVHESLQMWNHICPRWWHREVAECVAYLHWWRDPVALLVLQANKTQHWTLFTEHTTMNLWMYVTLQPFYNLVCFKQAKWLIFI